MKLRIYVAALVALTPFTSCAFKGIPHRRTPRVSAGCRMSASSSPSPSAETFFKHREKGRVAELSGRLDVAREHFLRALQHQKAVGNIPLASLLFQLANVQAERGEAEEAVRLYRSSFETWPELAEQCDAQNNLGLALEQCKRSNEALEAYSAAISSEPWRPEPRVS
jgi:tetratricopeptide (TPR) repeat protein